MRKAFQPGNRAVAIVDEGPRRVAGPTRSPKNATIEASLGQLDASRPAVKLNRPEAILFHQHWKAGAPESHECPDRIRTLHQPEDEFLAIPESYMVAVSGLEPPTYGL